MKVIAVSKTYVQTVTPEIAQMWLKSMPYQHQRNVNQGFVNQYSELMTFGKWQAAAPDPIVIVRNGASSMCVNGQHRLHAIVKSGTSQIFLIAEYESSDISNIDKMYTIIDRGRSRDTTAAYRAIQLATMIGISERHLNVTASAVKFINGNFTRKNDTRKIFVLDMAENILFYGADARHFFSLIYYGPKEMRDPIRRLSALSVALATIHYSASEYGMDRVNDFWAGVAFDDGLSRGDPRKTAHDHLLTTCITNVRTGFKSVTPMYQARYVAKCFNAWIEQRSVTKVVPDGDTTPIVIAGTPWNGTK